MCFLHLATRGVLHDLQDFRQFNRPEGNRVPALSFRKEWLRATGYEIANAGEDTFNRILWSIMKGPQPYPGTKRMSSLDIAREH